MFSGIIREVGEIKYLSKKKDTLGIRSNLSNLVLGESISCSGTLVEAYGKGVLIQGESSVGKSETALGLIERQHRLVSDDVVIITKREGSYLEGEGPNISRHLLEIRGIG